MRQRQPVISHLAELRKRFLRFAFLSVLVFVLGFFFSNLVISELASMAKGQNVSIVVISPTEYILTRLSVTLWLTLFAILPFGFAEFYYFAKPGLNNKERKLFLRTLLPAFLLFYAGFMFCLFFVSPLTLKWLKMLTPSYIANMLSLRHVIKFFLGFSSWFGVCLEFPLIIFVLGKLGIIKTKHLIQNRKRIYIVIFILAAVITPPDIVSQLVLGLPLVLLYELTIVMLKLTQRKQMHGK